MNTQDLDMKYLERYAATYNLVRTIPRDRRFNLSYYALANEDTECGTTACACGHAALHPWFRARGFRPNDYSVRTGRVNLFNETQAFYGCEGNDLPMPFNPDIFADDPHRAIDPNDPKQIASVIWIYMRMHWRIGEVESAVIRTNYVTYKPEFVHAYTPWNKDSYKGEDWLPDEFPPP